MPGSEDLKLPEDIRDAVHEHLKALHERFEKRGWAGRVGFGESPALIVIDLAKRWVDPSSDIGADLESVVENTCKVLVAGNIG